jgi:hypothetical protein
METTNNNPFEKVGKELPFTVPENYFEQFATGIENQIGYTSTHRKMFKPWMYAVAAVFLGFVVLTPILRSHKSQSNIVGSTENYETYVLSQVDETVMYDSYVVDNNANK